MIARRAARLAAGAIGALALVVLAGVLWPVPAAPLPDARGAYVITGVRVIDVEAGAAGPPMSVVVRAGRIAAIGTDVDTAGLVQVDGRGAYLAPGFWDMHVHSFQVSPQMHFPLWVANGVTHVRDMMDCPGATDSLIACAADKQGWNRESARGALAAPRIVEVASHYLDSPDLTPAEVSTRVIAARQRGINAVKVYNRLQPPAYRRAAAEARRLGMRLVGHLPKAIALETAIAAGQASFEHAHVLSRHCFARNAAWRADALDGLSPTALAEAMVREHDPAACAQAFAAMRSAGVWYVPTHVTREEDARAHDPAFAADPRLDYLDPLLRWAYGDDLAGTAAAYPGARGAAALGAYFDHGLALTGAAHGAGVKILVGTDTAIGGFRYHDEMAHLARAGLSPAAVLRAATIDAARYAGLEASSGSIAVGKQADLVLLDANPLEDIAATRRIRAVFLRGRPYDRAGLDALLAHARGQARVPHTWIKLVYGFAASSVNGDL